MCCTQKFSFSRDPVILDLKLQLAKIDTQKNRVFRVRIEYDTRKNRVFQVRIEYDTRKKSSISGLGSVSSSILDTHSKT
jgi:hypothetical protein